jgi:hypothetical protein
MKNCWPFGAVLRGTVSHRHMLRWLYPFLIRINAYLIRWIRKRFKRLRTFKKAHASWRRITRQYPQALAHWAWVPTFW